MRKDYFKKKSKQNQKKIKRENTQTIKNHILK